jgi:hypothetical protein
MLSETIGGDSEEDTENGKIGRGIGRELGGALGKSRKDKWSIKNVGEASVEGIERTRLIKGNTS